MNMIKRKPARNKKQFLIRNKEQVVPHLNTDLSSFVSDQKQVQSVAHHCSKSLHELLLSYKS